MAVEYGSMPSAAALEPSPARYDVAIVEPDGRQRMRLGTMLATAAQFEAVEGLVQSLHQGRPVVAVFGPGLAAPYGFQQVNRLIASYPDLGAIFAVDEVSTPLLQAAIRAGARDTVAVNDAGALVQSVQRVGELLAGTASRVPATTQARAAAGQLIAVFSAKGGVGKSTVAINVAAAMAHRSVDRVALVDADLGFGDVAVLLGLPPQHTILDAISATQYGDIELVRSMLVQHRTSGLLVLPAPAEPMLGGGVAPSDVISVCRALQGMCAFVVVDLPSQLDEYAGALLEAADTVLLIGGMDIPSVKNLRIGMQVLDLGAIAGPKLRLVLNRSNTQVKLDVREIEQVLGLRAEFPIPADIAVPISVNAGVPVVENDPRSPASRALDRIAVSLMGPEPVGGKKHRRGKRDRAALR